MMPIQTAQPAAAIRRTNVWAVAAFVVTLLGWNASPMLGGIFAFVALRQINQSGAGGRGLAEIARAVAILLTITHIVLWRELPDANW
jgi:hypothetical protein